MTPQRWRPNGEPYHPAREGRRRAFVEAAYAEKVRANVERFKRQLELNPRYTAHLPCMAPVGTQPAA